VGPADIFRNPEAIFCLFEKPSEVQHSPFDLHLATAGDDFAIMGMHFKLGLYEHQSAGAIHGLIELLIKNPRLLQNPSALRSLRITIYEPAFGIIGDPAKRDPRTRQSADHSMVYIVATLLRKAYESGKAGWIEQMLAPSDYDEDALGNQQTREIIDKIEFRHGGPEYDALYPDGIPTTLEIDHDQLGSLSSDLVMYPEGHARNASGNLSKLLEHKFRLLGSLAVEDVDALLKRFTGIGEKSTAEIYDLFNFEIQES
jgi:2-methylcitrate dehydratase